MHLIVLYFSIEMNSWIANTDYLNEIKYGVGVHCLVCEGAHTSGCLPGIGVAAGMDGSHPSRPSS